MAAKQQTHTFSVQVSRRDEATNDVNASTSVDGTVVETTRIPAAENGKIDTAGIRRVLMNASREARVYATSKNVELSVTVNNLGAVKHYVIDPSGGVEQTSDAPTRATPAHAARQQVSRASNAPRRQDAPPSPVHSPRGATGHPQPRAPRVAARTPRPPAATAVPLRPRPSWSPDASNPNETDVKDATSTQPGPASAKPELIPVTDKKLRVKVNPANDGGGLRSAASKFKALARWQQVLIVVLGVIVAFVGLRACTGGGGDYTAICVDQRTAMRQLDPGPCQDGKVVYYVWYYVDSGEDLPKPNTEYSTAKGTFDKPTRGTITYS